MRERENKWKTADLGDDLFATVIGEQGWGDWLIAPVGPESWDMPKVP